jgi:Methyltransferase domain
MKPPFHVLQRLKWRATETAQSQVAARRSRRAQRQLLAEEQEALAAIGARALVDVPGVAAAGEEAERLRAIRRRLQLERDFDRQRPWVTRFEIEGRTYGGKFLAADDRRIGQFRASFPQASSILELGSLEGGHTFALAQLAGVERVVGLEGRAANVAKARFVHTAFDGMSRAAVEFVEVNLEVADLALYGAFDAVFCAGLLYHLPRPWELLQRIGEISDCLFLWTQIASEPRRGEEAGGYPGRTYHEYGEADPLSGLSTMSFWPTWDGLVRMLADAGFHHVELIERGDVQRRGPAVTLAAAKNTSS